MTTTNIGGGRAMQVCDVCGGVDDHPRHHIGGGDSGQYDAPAPDLIRRVAVATQDLPPDMGDRLMAELLDTGTTSRHLDCCRTVGCPTGECVARTAGAEDLRGGDLLNHLTKGA